MSARDIQDLLKDEHLNAFLSWFLVSVLLLTAFSYARSGLLVGAVFSLGVVFFVSFPAFVYENMNLMVPWEVVLLASIPILADVMGYSFLSSTFFGYVSVAAVALIIVIELQVFTPVKMTEGFAIFFVFLTTMAVAGTWAVVTWVSDLYLGTLFIPDHDLLMIQFIIAALSGLVAGVFFNLYFRRWLPVEERMEVEEH